MKRSELKPYHCYRNVVTCVEFVWISPDIAPYCMIIKGGSFEYGYLCDWIYGNGSSGSSGDYEEIDNAEAVMLARLLTL